MARQALTPSECPALKKVTASSVTQTLFYRMNQHLTLIIQISPEDDPHEKHSGSRRRACCWVPWSAGSSRSEDWHKMFLKQQPIHCRVNQNIALRLDLYLSFEKMRTNKSEQGRNEQVKEFTYNFNTMEFNGKILKFKILKPALLTQVFCS